MVSAIRRERKKLIQRCTPTPVFLPKGKPPKSAIIYIFQLLKFDNKLNPNRCLFDFEYAESKYLNSYMIQLVEV